MSSDGSTVLFRGLSGKSKLSVAEKRQLKSFASILTQKVADGRSFVCLITTDNELHKLNSQFLGHDYPTDVLSFPCAHVAELGDLAISIERAEVQARKFGHSRLDETRILMLHGVLHLLGMDHETDEGEMARLECLWRDQLALPNTLILRNQRLRST